MTDIKRNGPAISWKPPFSLDLTGVDPDIVYCVEVYNITCGGSDPAFTDCDVLDTNISIYTSELSLIYEVIVTPRSNIDGAMNGTTATVRGNLF